MITKAEIEQISVSDIDLQNLAKKNSPAYTSLMLEVYTRKTAELQKACLELLPKEK